MSWLASQADFIGIFFDYAEIAVYSNGEKNQHNEPNSNENCLDGKSFCGGR